MFTKLFLSFLFGVVAYVLWLAAFLLLAGWDGGTVGALLWLAAPAVTALGFTVGISYYNRWSGAEPESFRRVFVWPFVGCTLGAIAVYWLGPMLIVAGLLVAGLLGTVAREFVARRRR